MRQRGKDMKESIPKTRLRIECPARYQILLQGRLDERWRNRLGGLNITAVIGPTGLPMTHLSGEVLDQAALFGVLNTLYNLQLPLISVVFDEDDGAA